MQLITNYGDLSEALNLAASLMPSRPPVPILGGVRITADETDGILVEAYDYETHVQVRCDGVVGRPGAAVVSLRGLREYTRTLLVGSSKAKQSRLPVTVGSDGSRLSLVADDYEYTLPLMTLQDYPAVPGYDGEQLLTVSRDALADAVKKVGVAAGRDDTLPMLTGICFTTVPGGVELAATDRFRLAVAFVPTVETLTDVRRLVPAVVLPKILAALPGGPATVGISGDRSGHVRFSAGRVSVSSQCLDVEFVKYPSLIPAEHTLRAVVDRAELAVAIRRVAAAVDRQHHIRLGFTDGAVRLSAGGDEGYVSSPPIRIEQDGADLPAIGFNPGYLGQALGSFGTDSVEMGLTKPGRPILIAEPGRLGDERALRVLVMPARLPDEPVKAASSAEPAATAAVAS